MANRIKHILEWQPPERALTTYGLKDAFCACIGPEEACELLKACAQNDPDLRSIVLRKIGRDIEATQSSCHIELVEDLIKASESSDYRGRQALGRCLSVLASIVDSETRKKILRTFLASPHLPFRRRAYKSIGDDISGLEAEVEQTWRNFNDTECSWLITKTFPTLFLIKNRHELLNTFSEGWQYSRLYLRIGEKNPQLIAELFDIDEISYCYVLAKLSKSIEEKTAKAIVDGNLADDRFGLLVWSIGRMKLWNILKYIEERLVDIQRAQQARLLQKFSGNLSA